MFRLVEWNADKAGGLLRFARGRPVENLSQVRPKRKARGFEQEVTEETEEALFTLLPPVKKLTCTIYRPTYETK
jgi:hypothetical protein